MVSVDVQARAPGLLASLTCSYCSTAICTVGFVVSTLVSGWTVGVGARTLCCKVVGTEARRVVGEARAAGVVATVTGEVGAGSLWHQFPRTAWSADVSRRVPLPFTVDAGRDRMAAKIVAGIAAVAVVGWIAIAGTQGDDAGADQACEQFHTAAVDYSDGVLTDAELRERLQQVADRAAGSPVEDEARAMLAEVTSGTSSSFDAAVEDMSGACDQYR